MQLNLHSCKFLIYSLNRELDLLPSIISVVLLNASHSFVVLFGVLSGRLNFITCHIALERLCLSCLCAGYSFWSLDLDGSGEDKLRNRLVLLFILTPLSPMLASSLV